MKASTPAAVATLVCGRHRLSLERPRLMGVLNLTPDSFSDGGRFISLEAAVAHAEAMVEQGADLIDIGGESTRPGAHAVVEDEELRRVIPVVEELARRLPVPLSVDTSKPAVMRAAVAAGAGMINDVRALRADGALEWAASTPDIALVLMHMQGEPRSMQRQPEYGDVVAEVGTFLEQRRAAAVAAGIDPARLVCDPGFGFGKTLAHNLSLLRALPALVGRLGPLLVGLSRKSMFAQLLGDRPPAARVAASVQTALLAAQGGAAILRVHDVRETREALELLAAVENAR